MAFKMILKNDEIHLKDNKIAKAAMKKIIEEKSELFKKLE
jgi:flagellar biosynthesis/type III secretory pathway chaperone